MVFIKVDAIAYNPFAAFNLMLITTNNKIRLAFI